MFRAVDCQQPINERGWCLSGWQSTTNCQSIVVDFCVLRLQSMNWLAEGKSRIAAVMPISLPCVLDSSYRHCNAGTTITIVPAKRTDLLVGSGLAFKLIEVLLQVAQAVGCVIVDQLCALWNLVSCHWQSTRWNEPFRMKISHQQLTKYSIFKQAVCGETVRGDIESPYDQCHWALYNAHSCVISSSNIYQVPP